MDDSDRQLDTGWSHALHEHSGPLAADGPDDCGVGIPDGSDTTRIQDDDPDVGLVHEVRRRRLEVGREGADCVEGATPDQ